MGGIRLQTVSGSALEPYIQALARLRISVFRDFPYLYDGTLAYEERYLQTYLRCPQAAVVLAFAGDEVVGASSCLPLQAEDEAFKQPWRQYLTTGSANFTLDQLFYCAESVLDARYRGQGIGVGFFREREAHAARLGGFTHACFCAVDRAPDHPLRPAAYIPLDEFWRKRGYRQQPGLQARFHWKDINQPVDTEKTLTFWLKALKEMDA